MGESAGRAGAGVRAAERAPADGRAPITEVLLIANPGSRRGARLHRHAREAFEAAGVRCDVVITERPGHGAEVCAERASRYGAVFTLGGDGTAVEVIDSLAGSGTPVGVLAGGTGNMLALALGIPVGVRRAVPALLAGDEALIDLGVIRVGGATHRFALTAGVGVDARMIELTPAPLKRRYGVLAYAVAAVRAIFWGGRFRVRVDADGETIEREVVALMVANFGTVLKNVLQLGPGIKQDDGRLDLCLFCPRNALEAVQLAWRLFRKDFRPHAGLLYRSGLRFTVECTPPQTLQADGEVRGKSPFEVTVEPLAARLLVPARRDARR